jgi:hypothetical protein
VRASSESKVCGQCGVEAPDTQTDYTLIGRKHAWRLEGQTDAQGRFLLTWHCPDCWREKQANIRGATKPR